MLLLLLLPCQDILKGLSKFKGKTIFEKHTSDVSRSFQIVADLLLVFGSCGAIFHFTRNAILHVESVYT